MNGIGNDIGIFKIWINKIPKGKIKSTNVNSEIALLLQKPYGYRKTYVWFDGDVDINNP